MDPFLFCFCLGFLGFALMTVLGFSHGHGAARDGHGHAHGHETGHGHTISHSHGAHGTHSHTAAHGAHSSSFPKLHGDGIKTLLAWLSPRVLFALLLGFGGTGLLIENHLKGSPQFVVSLFGAWFFKRWMFDPLWNLVFAFASKPAQTLESALLEEAEAVVNFDGEGRGLVAFELDGQIVQMLGTLERQEYDKGIRVRSGDRLMIIQVDPKRHRCTVVRSRV